MLVNAYSNKGQYALLHASSQKPEFAVIFWLEIKRSFSILNRSITDPHRSKVSRRCCKSLSWKPNLNGKTLPSYPGYADAVKSYHGLSLKVSKRF